MSGKLIIIRGNSGSGKSTIASKLRYKMGYGTMLIPQDVVRRDIIRVADDLNNPAIKLIGDIALYGKRLGYDVIIEGILNRDKYGAMLHDLSLEFDETHVYYFDISFDETMKRHESKQKKDEFGRKEMQEWWVDKDYLNLPGEYLLTADMQEAEIVDLIFKRAARE